MSSGAGFHPVNCRYHPSMPSPRQPSPIPAIREVMMPRDTNPQGTIFGGVILSLIDQAAFVEARRQAPQHKVHRWVTVAMDSIEFHEPVLVGDVVSLWANTVRVGRTSICIHVMVEARLEEEAPLRKVTEARVTFVALDAGGRPTPVLHEAPPPGGPA